MDRKIFMTLPLKFLVGLFVLYGFNLPSVSAGADLATQQRAEIVANLNPAPQSITFSDGDISLTTGINLIGTQTADAAAVANLTAFLQARQFKLNETYDAASTTIVLGEHGEESAALHTQMKSLGIKEPLRRQAEGYLLVSVQNGQSAGTILIEGADEAGTFYGVQTLKQLLTFGGDKFPQLRIVDYPVMKERGVVEGFYGNPWTHQDRLAQLNFYGANKLNTYIYAPKDDPYHRAKWREAYPKSKMAGMQELINTAKANKVDFVFAVSPGNDISFDGAQGEKDFQALLKKFESLYAMGVRSFAVFYDDIADKSAVKQAAVLNRVNQDFVQKKGDVKPLWTVPTEYYTQDMADAEQKAKPYTKDFAATLDKDIIVMYTGPAVVCESISKADIRFVGELYGRKMAIWWNYPVTDYLTNQLALGPIYGLKKDLAPHTDYFVMNPMEHAELSKITLFTGADYGWNPADYAQAASWEKAMQSLYGDLAADMRIFADHSTRMDNSWAHTGRQDAGEMRALMDTLWQKLSAGERAKEEIEKLHMEFNAMERAYNRLKKQLPEEDLTQCAPQLELFGTLAAADRTALAMVEAKLAGDQHRYEKLQVETKENQRIIAATKARLSTKTAIAFIEEALRFTDYAHVLSDGPTSILIKE